MNKSDFRRLLRYSDNCWAQLGDVLTTALHAAETWDARFDTTSHWNTVRLLLAHRIGAEERWITLRLQNHPLPVIYEDRAAADWEGLYRDHQTVRAATYAYLDGLTDAAVADETVVLRRDYAALTMADVLFHIVNHENYHRGQVVMTLQRHGIDPPNFDYIFLKEGTGQTRG